MFGYRLRACRDPRPVSGSNVSAIILPEARTRCRDWGNLGGVGYRLTAMKRYILLSLFALVVTACGGGASSPTSTTTPVAGWDRDPTAPLVIIETFGGFVPVEVALGQMPEIALYGDGTVITQGPTIAIWPGPALPNLVAGHLDDATIRDILDRAAVSGVLSPLDDYGTANVADAGTTRIAVTVDGKRTVTEIYALGIGGLGGETPGLSSEQRTARAGASSFIDFLRQITDAAPAEEFIPTAYAVRPWPFGGVPSESPEMAWPFGSLAVLGNADAVGGCMVIDGDDAGQLRELAGQATSQTPWISDGVAYGLVFRALLPDETSCDDLG